MTLHVNGKYITVSDISRENILNGLSYEDRFKLEVTGIVYIVTDGNIVTIYDMP